MVMSEIINRIEEYLLETRQINRLAIRQSRVLRRSITDKNLQDEIRAILLLALAALNRGAPRADIEFMMNPLKRPILVRYSEAIEQTSQHQPDWAGILTDPETGKKIKTILNNLINNPLFYAPLAGTLPETEEGSIPLLITNRQTGMMGFSRYWYAVMRLEKNLRIRLAENPEDVPVQKAVDVLVPIFGKESILPEGSRFHERQAAAAALALRTRFLIVSGGPGTGKTSVIIQILRALLRHDAGIEPDRIVLCAPTGRAKARMGESIDSGIADMEKFSAENITRDRARDCALKNLQRKTLHGLLGVRSDGSLKYCATNPLPHQIIVVDEASMVDIHLFSGLIEAAHPECRIILLGDMHQLPSVEAGAVLGDLTARFILYEGFPTLKKETGLWVKHVLKSIDIDKAGKTDTLSLAFPSAKEMGIAGPLADHAVILTHSYRSSGGILELCRHVNRGNTDEALKIIDEGKYSNTLQLETRGMQGAITGWLKSHYLGEHLKPLEEICNIPLEDPGDREVKRRLESAFNILAYSRILVLGHEGESGRNTINGTAERILRPALHAGRHERHFHGQQVILVKNHHDLDLYNGDLGIVVQSKNEGLKAVFRRGNSFSVQAVERLRGLEPAYAMTVHKSQGSEFDEVLLVLPEHESPLLSRQIIYTAITRARKLVRILGSRATLKKAIETHEERPGGLVLDQ